MNAILKNLTGFPVAIIDGIWATTIPYDDWHMVPFMNVNREPLGKVAGISIERTTWRAPNYVPEPEPDTIWIVEKQIAEHPDLCDRKDLAYPGDDVRDNNGKVIGCNGLCAGPGLASVLRGQAGSGVMKPELLTQETNQRIWDDVKGRKHAD